ncbi:MAG: PAAR domain-containing protein [Sandaracinaceae bacterium]|nr:PAAR domain-containing protein [Sandaracinaceae bacterium]
MSNAARTTDAVSHGGAIVTGSPDVLTEGLASARLFDLVKCEVHGVAVIGQTSKTVLVNGRGFARKGDGCVCAGAGAAGPGQKDLVLFILSVHGSDKTLDEIVEETNGHGPHLEGVLSDANADGVLDTFSMKGGLMGFALEGKYGSFGMEAFSGELEIANVRGANAIDGAIPINQTWKAHGEVAALKGEGSLNLGDEASIEAKGSLFKADADAELLAGDDGRRVGLIAKAGAGASAASGSGTAVVDTTAGGFLDKLAVASPVFAPAAIGARALARVSPTAARWLSTPVKLEASAGVSGGSVGLDGEVEAYYDRQTEETHLGIGGEIAALLGLGVDLHLTIGGKGDDAGQTGDSGPNVIIAGAGTVLVGD